MTTKFVAVAFGYWGRGDTQDEAVDQCRKAGAKKRDRTVVYQNDFDEATLGVKASLENTPYVDSHGGVNYHGELKKVAVLDGGKVKSLIGR